MVEQEKYRKLESYNKSLSSEIETLRKELGQIKEVLNTATAEVDAARKTQEVCHKIMDRKDNYIGQIKDQIAKTIQQQSYDRQSAYLREKDALYVYHEKGLMLYANADQKNSLA